MNLRRVAYVEDEDDIRTLTELSLSAIGGFDVQTFSSGQDALANLKDVKPDLILTDVMMPLMDGPELLRRVAADPDLCTIPAVFITAKSMARERADLMDQGVAAVITKPYDPMTLPDELREIWKMLQDRPGAPEPAL